MKKNKILLAASRAFILLSSLSLLSVSMMAIGNPQSVMNLVHVNLDNTDAISSIRGIYGGVGIVLCITLAYLMIKDPRKGLTFLIMFWGAYALSRLYTLIADGQLGSFGRQWLIIETAFFFIAGALLWCTIAVSRERKENNC